MGNKQKHLEFIQAVITRMAGNSFLIRGWSVTVVSALFALQVVDGSPCLISITYLPVIVFWCLDAYYLRQEKLYRKLYDAVRILEEKNIDFSLETSTYSKEVACIPKLCFSNTVLIFHGALLIAVITADRLAG